MIGWFIEIIIRLLTPFLVIGFPVAGSIASILADMTDIIVLDKLQATNIPQFYNQFDKLFDFYMYCFMGFQAWRGWKNTLAKKTALGLLFFRGVGVVIYEIFPARWLLLAFPNVFVWFYLFHLFSTQLFNKDYVRGHKPLAIILLTLTIPKLYQEYLFHVVQVPLYQWFQTFIGMIAF